jgi:hypothetical protein
MRICVSVGGLCSLLLCLVLHVLFSNTYRSSRCACVFELVGCGLSCCLLCCVSCFRMHINPLDVHMCLCSLLLCVVLRVLFSNAYKSSRCGYVFVLSVVV